MKKAETQFLKKHLIQSKKLLEKDSKTSKTVYPYSANSPINYLYSKIKNDGLCFP